MKSHAIQRLTCGLLVCGLVLAATMAQGEDWPRFRGPSAAGQTSATDVPLTWSDSENILWKVEMPGPGASSPVILGDRLYLTCYTGYGLSEESPGEKGALKRHLLCFNKDNGELIWNAPMEGSESNTETYRGFVALHGFTSSTPVVDETGIYVFYGTAGAAAYNHEGELLWNTPLGSKTHNFGTANSPVLYKDLVIVNAGVESGAIVALNKKTGEKVWQWDGVNRSWNTPILVEVESGTELVFNDQELVRGINPENGEELWRCQAIDDYICPSVIAVGDMLYAVGARQNKTVAIKAGGRGDVTETHLVWELNKGSNVSSPSYHEGHLYWVSEGKGIAYCANAETGELVYEERLDPRPGRIYASPVVAAGHLFYVSRDKGTYVLPAKPKYEVVAHNTFESDDSIFNGSPAVVDNKMYLRSDKAIYCLGK